MTTIYSFKIFTEEICQSVVFFLECLLFTKSRRTSNDLNSGIIL